MRTKAISLLQELTEAHSVSGHEDEVRAIFVDELAECGELSTDRNGSVFCETGDDGPRVLVAGHMDEVGFMVQNITPDGFIQFLAIGGWWEHNLLSQRVEILTRSGNKMLGVIASRPPHFLPEAQRRQVMTIDRGETWLRDLGFRWETPLLRCRRLRHLGGKTISWQRRLITEWEWLGRSIPVRFCLNQHILTN